MIQITPELVEIGAIPDYRMNTRQKVGYTQQTMLLGATLSMKELEQYLRIGRKLNLREGKESYTYFYERLDYIQNRLNKDFGVSLEDTLE